jgi:hypothetical protein
MRILEAETSAILPSSSQWPEWFVLQRCYSLVTGVTKRTLVFRSGGSFADYDIFVVIVIVIIKLSCSSASHRGVWVNGILDPHFLIVSTRWWFVVSFSPPAALPPWAVFPISIN